MSEVQRRVTYRLYPTPRQAVALEERRALHCELYNAAIEERREAWRRQGRSISYYDQQNQLPEIKEVRPDLEPLGSHALQATCRRVDHAYKAFFKRSREGKTPGYPRFKSRRRFKGWTWPDPTGWKLVAPEKRRRHRPRGAVLRVSDLGDIKIRGRARNEGEPVTCTITRRGGGWYASIVIDCEPVRRHGTEKVGFDWGLDSFLMFDDGSKLENPRFIGKEEVRKLRGLSKDLSRKRLGSKNWRKSARRIARFHDRIERRREDFQHKESARIVDRSALIATEGLDTKELIEKEDQPRARRRAILDGAPASFLQKVRYKAEEASTGYKEVPTVRVKPSQRCPGCFRLCGKKRLDEREHHCPFCGWRGPRDQASAKVCLQWAEGRRLPGRGPASTVEGWARKDPLGSRKPNARRASASGR